MHLLVNAANFAAVGSRKNHVAGIVLHARHHGRCARTGRDALTSQNAPVLFQEAGHGGERDKSRSALIVSDDITHHTKVAEKGATA